jgi:hypothetical protein
MIGKEILQKALYISLYIFIFGYPFNLGVVQDRMGNQLCLIGSKSVQF